jgi:type I restriction enzyme, S subunit
MDNKLNFEIPYVEDLPQSWGAIQNRYLFLENKVKVGESFSNYQLLSLTTLGVKEKDINASGGKVPESYENYLAISKNQLIFCLFDLDVSAVFSGISRYNGMITSAYNAYDTTSKINVEYADYWFQYVFTNRYYMMYSKNIRYSVTGQSFKSIYTPVPPLDIQERIVSVLNSKTSKIDKLITNQQKQIEKLKAYKQSLISEVVTKGLNPNVEFKDSGIEWIEKIPLNWDIKPFKVVFKLNKGISITKEDLVDEGVPVINYGEIHSKYGFEFNPLANQLKCINPEVYENANPNTILQKGDFVFCDTSEDLEGSGNFSILNDDQLVVAGYHTIVAKPMIYFDSRYLAYLFTSDYWRIQIRSKVYGIKLYSITQSILKSISLILPPQDDQLRISSFLDSKVNRIERIIEIKKMKINELNNYKKSLIYEYVTGKKEVS